MLQQLSTVRAQLQPLITPLLDQLASVATDSPTIVSVGFFVLLLLIAMQILNFARRILVFWTKVVFRLMFWGGIVLAASVVLQRGVGRTAEDAVGWWGEISEVWWREYQRWEGQQNKHRDTNAGTSWR